MTLVPIDWQDEEILRQIDLLSFGLNLLGDPKKLQLRLVIELVATAALAVPDVVFVRRVKDLANDKHLFIDSLISAGKSKKRKGGVALIVCTG
jgi:hypothetical protein